MRTKKQIKEMITKLENMNSMNKNQQNDYLRMVNQGSINALEWVIEE